MWESQQCSQAASGSQNSQGSYELFSQPLRQSQQKGSAYDKWSQHGSSQQTNEVKYKNFKWFSQSEKQGQSENIFTNLGKSYLQQIFRSSVYNHLNQYKVSNRLMYWRVQLVYYMFTFDIISYS